MNSTETPPSSTKAATAGYQPGPFWVALFAAAFTWPLLFVGGLVTTYRVGMAVPDWPTTFGMNMFLYKFWNGAWGVFIEHGHRLYGSAVGMACIVLAVWFLAAERRGWMKGLGVFALLAVIVQGVLGGYRVNLNSTNIAAIHGCFAQAFFGLMVALCVLTGRDWATAAPGSRIDDPAHLRRRAAVTLFLVYSQIVVGAWLRHFGSGPRLNLAGNLLPPVDGALTLHAVLASAVWGHAAMLAWRVERQKAIVPSLLPAARAMGLIVTLQVVLGIAAWWVLRPFDGIPRVVTNLQALIRTGHLAIGALLLASSVVLSLRSFRHLASPRSESRTSKSLEMAA